MPTSTPTIDYENYIAARVADQSVRLGMEPGSEREASLLEATREKFSNWAQLGNLYADLIGNPDTSHDLDEAIRVELEDLYEAAGNTVCTTDPAILRLLYPLLRDRACAREKGGQLMKLTNEELAKVGVKPHQRAQCDVAMPGLQRDLVSERAPRRQTSESVLGLSARCVQQRNTTEGRQAMRSVCAKCNGTGTEVVLGKGARACECRRRRGEKVIDLQAYRAENAGRVRQKESECELQEAERVRREVDGVMTFFEARSPDFITGAVVDAIWEACARLGIEEPTYENDLETRRTLNALFSKTKMLDLRDEWSNKSARSSTGPLINSGDTPA